MRSLSRPFALSLAALVLVSCGDDDAGDSSPDTSSPAAPSAGPTTSAGSATTAVQGSPSSSTAPVTRVAPLSVTSAGTNPLLVGTVGVGIAAGIFDDLGLEVDFSVIGRQGGINSVVAGQADLTETNTNNAGAIEKEGKDVSAVWAASGGGLGITLLVGADGPTTVEEFVEQAADGCVFGVSAPGSSGYGYAKIFTRALGVDCEILELGETAQIVGAVVTGRVDAMANALTNTEVAAAYDAGELRVLLDTADPSIATLDIPQYTERVWIGLAENLESKRESVERFVEGMKRAAELFETMPADEIAELLLTIEPVAAEFPADDRDLLVEAIESARPFVNWNDGFISAEDWALGLATASEFEVPDFDPSDPARSYEAVIDMSFYEAAEP